MCKPADEEILEVGTNGNGSKLGGPQRLPYIAPSRPECRPQPPHRRNPSTSALLFPLPPHPPDVLRFPCVYACPRIPTQIQGLIIAVMYERCRGSESRWAPYLDLLPQGAQGMQHMPLYWKVRVG